MLVADSAMGQAKGDGVGCGVCTMPTITRLLTSLLALLVWSVRAWLALTTSPIESADTREPEKKKIGKMI